jgi:hypothetical protein
MMEAEATLHIEVIAECPYCEEPLDLMEDYNDEGQVISQACPDGCWIDEHKNFEITRVECPACSKKFDVKGLEW